MLLFIDAYTISFSIKLCTACGQSFWWGKFSVLHRFTFERGSTDNNWREGLLLNVFQTAGSLIKTPAPDSISCGLTKRIQALQTASNVLKDDIHVILGHFFSFPFLWPPIFTPSKAENHTKTNKCTGCVNTEYRRDGEGLTFTFLSFFLYGSDQLYLNNKLITSWQHCKKEEG